MARRGHFPMQIDEELSREPRRWLSPSIAITRPIGKSAALAHHSRGCFPSRAPMSRCVVESSSTKLRNW